MRYPTTLLLFRSVIQSCRIHGVGTFSNILDKEISFVARSSSLRFSSPKASIYFGHMIDRTVDVAHEKRSIQVSICCLFPTVVVVTCWWILAQPRMVPFHRYSKNGSLRWEIGLKWMVTLFIKPGLGELRTIQRAEMCGKFLRTTYYYNWLKSCIFLLPCLRATVKTMVEALHTMFIVEEQSGGGFPRLWGKLE